MIQTLEDWSAVTGATSYNLYRSTTAGGEGSTPYRSGLTARGYTDTGWLAAQPRALSKFQ